MSERARKSADRIREQVPIIQLLADYGYEVDLRGGDREQQFACDLHGDGQDSKPSGRAYPDSGQFFCFACAKSRDAIALVLEKEGLTFWESIRFLEKKYNLEPLPWEEEAEDRKPTLRQELDRALERSETAEQALHRLETFLKNLCQDRSLDAQRCAGLWEAHDRVRFFLSEKGDSEVALTMARKVLSAAKDALRPREELPSGHSGSA